MFPKTFYKKNEVFIEDWGNFLKSYSKVLYNLSFQMKSSYKNYCHFSIKKIILSGAIYIFLLPLPTNGNPFEKKNTQFNDHA